jgi:hypothetical protein
MLSGSDFRFQRHLEIWKDQNRHIKRVVLATLIFGLLILIRVLIPLNHQTLETEETLIKIGQEQDSLEKINVLSKELEQSLSQVEGYIQRKPWEREKDALIRRFQSLNQNDRNINPQRVADESIGRIVDGMRISILHPLEVALNADSTAESSFPVLRGELEEYSSFIDRWEQDHLGRNWYGTISEKNVEMRRLTRDINQRTERFSRRLESKIEVIQQEISARETRMSSLDNDVVHIRSDLEKVLEDILPKWLQGVIRVRHMVQLYPFLLLIMVLYTSWLIYSLAKHYHHVKTHIEFEEEDKSDISSSSLWTLSLKNQFGILMTTLIYGVYFIVIWILFELGLGVFYQWALVSGTGSLLINQSSMNFGIWMGRLIFILLLFTIVFFRQIPLFRKIVDRPKVNIT